MKNIELISIDHICIQLSTWRSNHWISREFIHSRGGPRAIPCSCWPAGRGAAGCTSRNLWSRSAQRHWDVGKNWRDLGAYNVQPINLWGDTHWLVMFIYFYMIIYIYVYMCIYILCIYIHTHIHTVYIYLHIHIDTVYVYIYTYTYTYCVCIYI